MNFSKKGFYSFLVALASGGILSSCVDNDYDLTKDIDLTVNVGGDLSLPGSSTELYTVAQILDLSSNSSIKPDGQLYGLGQGDYVLVQGGDPTNTSVSIPLQTLNDIQCNSSQASVQFVSPGNVAYEATVGDFVNQLDIADSSIDPAVKSLSHAKTNIVMNFRIGISESGGASGSVTFKPGFTISFPASWTISLNSADASMAVEGSKVVFKQAKTVAIGSTVDIPVVITGVDLTRLPEGQGLYAPGKFRLNDRIVSGGPIAVTSSMATGQAGTLLFDIAPVIPSASITEVTGSIDPKVNVDATSFAINDIPDFLKEPGNHLDVYNPQIRLTVNNASPVEINLNCRVVATDQDGVAHEVWIGDAHGTAPITIKGSGVSEICISRLGEGASQGGVNVAVPDLATLIETIPQQITFDNVDAKVPEGREFTLTLGRDYAVSVDYLAVVPLAFGSQLKFNYTTDETGWDEDLHKYSFRKAVASLEVENSAPLDMVPEVVALDRNGNEISDIVATVEGSVAAGTKSMPSVSMLVVTLTSDAANIGNLDGVRFSFRATCPPGLAGTPLNEGQALRFTNIKVKLVGGVGVDLN